MKFKKGLLLTIVILFSVLMKNYAIPAYPFPVKITQPDGTTITIVRKGNPHFHYDTTEDGILVIKNKDGIYDYATLNKDGKIQSTRIKARNKIERTQKERDLVCKFKTIPSPEPYIKKIESQKMAKISQFNPNTTFPRVGSPKSLVILVNFSDLQFVVDNPQKAYKRLLNQEGYSENGGTGSARDYFIDVSRGTFSPEFEVIGPYTLPHDYAYYGKNKDDNDERPTDMIVDACKLADADIDFNDYDIDKDGNIDNVFVYYAGHNEAEYGGDDTVWPHRWAIYPGQNYSGSVSDVTFDGKRLYDYACTSELRGSGGREMCGIGTFTHEFGHVLGLTDMYPTGGQQHHTLSSWDVMDLGPYLNRGRTPPTYNAFQRFKLGFMKPTILKGIQSVALKPINTSNEAFLISPSGMHNLIGSNPFPTEFFLLENRQKTGWDKYLPGHGMLIYRINYSRNDWQINSPNNDPNNMGVDLIEADQIANSNSLAGDPFPGTANVTDYIPTLRSGEELVKKSILNIREKDNMIYFSSGMIPTYVEPPKNLKVDDITYKDFVVSWDKVLNGTKDAAGYYVTVFQKKQNGDSILVVDDRWTENTSVTIYSLTSDREYIVKVKASDKDTIYGYENITGFSKSVFAKTLPYPDSKELRCTVNNGTVRVFVPYPNDSGSEEAVVNIFDTLGQRVYSISTNNDVVEVSDLPKNVVLIVQSGKKRKKIILI